MPLFGLIPAMTHNSLLKMAYASILACFLLASASLQAQSTNGAPQQIHWTQLDDAQLKLDSKPPLAWGVYQPDKKSRKKGSELVLILVGHRYMMLDIKARLVYLVMPSDLHAQGKDFESGDLANASNLIPSTDWTVRDVGPAELIRLTLGDYGRTLDVSLSHPPDLTSFY
jgi:hypothetical protein